MKKLQRPIVVIFGAGATRGGIENTDEKNNVPPPVDKDFFDLANQLIGHQTPRLAGKVLDDVWKLYNRTYNIGLESYYRELETRALIGGFAKTASRPKDWRKRQSDLEELIRRVIVQTTTKNTGAPTVEKKESKAHKNLLKRLKQGDTVITFNYDLVIEESFESAKLWNPIDGYDMETSGKTMGWTKRWLIEKKYKSGAKSAIKLLKLHGSINWKLIPDKIKLKPKPYLVTTRNGTPRPETISILAPGWNKRIDKNPYKKLWRNARLRLEKCKTLVIVGYSLPETDLLAHALLSEVVRMRAKRKDNLKQLHLADPNEGVKERFIELFTPTLGSRGEIFKYKNIKQFNEKMGSSVNLS